MTSVIQNAGQPKMTLQFKRHLLGLAGGCTLAVVVYAGSPAFPNETGYKQQATELLKSIETGESKPLTYINPTKYIQHNLAVADGLAGVKALLQSLPRGATKVNTVRVLQDGNFVILHTDYNFFGPKVGFDIFRFEDGRIVEHWDNLQETALKPSPSGHTMIDGPTVISDLDKTETNKALMQTYMDDLLHGRKEKFSSYFEGNNYIQHNPLVADNLTGLFAGLKALANEGQGGEVRSRSQGAWGRQFRPCFGRGKLRRSPGVLLRPVQN